MESWPFCAPMMGRKEETGGLFAFSRGVSWRPRKTRGQSQDHHRRRRLEFLFLPFFEVNSCHHHHLVMSLRTHVVPPGWWKVKFVPVGCPIKWGFKVTISSVVPRGWSDDRAKTGHDSPVAMIFVWFSCLTSAKKKNSIICAKRI